MRLKFKNPVNIFLLFIVFIILCLLTLIINFNIYSNQLQNRRININEFGNIETISNNLPSITDVNGIVLADNKFRYRIYYKASTTNFKNDEIILNYASDLLKLNDLYKNYLEYVTNPDKTRRDDFEIDYSEKYDNLISLYNSPYSKNFTYQLVEVRQYNSKYNFGNLIGYSVNDFRTGIEKQIFDENLFIEGKEIKLTLDANLSNDITNILYSELNKNAIKAGSIMLMDVTHNKILASISLPNFNGNDFTNYQNDKITNLLNDLNYPLLNRNKDLTYPAGSTMKMLTGLTSIDSGVIDRNSYIMTEGCMQLPNYRLCEYAKNPFGNINIVKAIGVSSNIFFCKLFTEKKLSIDKFNEIQSKFGMQSYTGLAIGNEAKGTIPSPKYKQDTFGDNWYYGDSCNASIGQGYTLVTPAQVLNFTNTIARNGVKKNLSYIDSIKLKSKDIQDYEYKEEQINLANDAYKIVSEGMHEVARIRSLGGLDIYMKTGTAEVSSHDPHTWATGYYRSQDGNIYSFVIFLEYGKVSENNVNILRKMLDLFKTNPQYAKLYPKIYG